MILHIPHSSTYIPPNVSFLKNQIEDDIFRMTDWFTDELFEHENSDRIVCGVSRLVCDVERFVQDDPMEEYGMGVCYTHDSYGNLFRVYTDEEKDSIINQYYKPHHSLLTKTISRTLSFVDHAMIVDCHSFNDFPMPHNNYDGARPDFCIGTDQYHTPQHVIDAMCDVLDFNEVSYQINVPFSGSIVPHQYYRKNKNVWSVMIEVNKKLYMDGSNKSSTWDRTKSIVDDLLNIIDDMEKNYENI